MTVEAAEVGADEQQQIYSGSVKVLCQGLVSACLNIRPGKLDLLFRISLHPLRPAASTVIITFQAMTQPLLMAVVP